jgi:hypothetical protein
MYISSLFVQLPVICPDGSIAMTAFDSGNVEFDFFCP